MHVTRQAVSKKKLVYLIVVKKPLKYKWRRSRIAYIGTTKKGMGRIAQSAAAKARAILYYLHGVREFWVRIITCPPRCNLKGWEKLERAILLCFRERYGEIPKCNRQGVKIRERDEFEYFKNSRIKDIFAEFE
jgi:hypothetical protein